DCIGNPIYESQRRSKKARIYLKAFRLRQGLGGSRPVLDPLPERPYRMKRVTYNRICADIQRLERPLVGSGVVSRAPKWIPPLVCGLRPPPRARSPGARAEGYETTLVLLDMWGPPP